MRWRRAAALPPAPWLMSSPAAPEARDANKRETAWTGDKGPITATGDDETANLRTAVTTTPATTSDCAVLPTMQANLAARQRTPREPLVDAGDVTADHRLRSRTAHGSALVGPAPADQRWQGPARNGCAAVHCVLDGEATHASCPQGQPRAVWTARPDRHGQATVRLACSTPGCAACARRAEGTRAASAPRALRLREHDHDTVLQAARAQQQTATFTQVYAHRAGLEGPMAQGTRRGDRRRSRDLGLVKTRLMHLLIAAALNVMRVAAGLADLPRAQTRPSAFAALAAAS
jgi:transposase